jgi:ABC-type polysaccharide/polyol phosphate transport system ATPase subunit
MSPARLHAHEVGLSENVVVAVEEVSKAAPRPDPQPPRWLARVLPGVQWSALADPDLEDEDDDLDEGVTRRQGALQPVSFELAAGQGLGLVGNGDATKTLLTLLIGLYPPSTGRIKIRGLVAPLLRFSELNFSGKNGKASLSVMSRFLHWPPDFLRNRWDEIVDFAHLEEVDELGFPPGSIEYDQARTKRLFLSAVMHLDASVYAVLRSFAGSDAVMFERCSELLEQRQREGCAIIQTGKAPADVAQYCHEAILFDETGAPVFRGRLGAVANVMAERRAIEKRKRAFDVAVRALLVGNDPEVVLGSQGGTIEIELDVFEAMNVVLRLRFVDSGGNELTVEYSEQVRAEPGIYRLDVAVPPGLLDDGSYTATLLASRPLPRKRADDEEPSPDGAQLTLEGVEPRPGNGGEPAPDGAELSADGDEPSPDAEEPPPAVELLSFEVSSRTGGDGSNPMFGVAAEDGDYAAPGDVEWDVRRIEA